MRVLSTIVFVFALALTTRAAPVHSQAFPSGGAGPNHSDLEDSIDTHDADIKEELENLTSELNTHDNDIKAEHSTIDGKIDGVQTTLDDLALQGTADGLDGLLNFVEPKLIFVTSRLYSGNFGGLEFADTECQELADAPGSVVPNDEYVALLSTSNTHAAARLTASIGPIIRPDGLHVAANTVALFSSGGPIFAPELDEMGIYQSESEVWTGAFSRGDSAEELTQNCEDWTATTDRTAGRVGTNSETDTTWNKPYHPTAVPQHSS